MSEPKDDVKKKLTGRDVAELLLGAVGSMENLDTRCGDLMVDQTAYQIANGTATTATNESTDSMKDEFPLRGENFRTVGKVEK